MSTEQDILKKLSELKHPATGQSLAAHVSVKDIRISGEQVSFALEVDAPEPEMRERIKESARRAVLSLQGVKGVSISLLQKSPAQHAAAASETRAGHHGERVLAAKFIIPVASGKGGVGKSTVSANLAVALAKLGHRVGLMDADVYGPSIPTLMGASEPPVARDGKMVPPERYGVKMISMGFFLPKGEAVIWRGPMLHKTVDQFLGSVEWGELDYLIIDLPPGTGDIQLSLCQKIPLSGAVIVSTPQDLAFSVAEKAIAMFVKLKTPILGIVENMSGFVCSHCHEREEVFGSGGARRHAESVGIPFLGEIPLATGIRSDSDEGRPTVDAHPDSPGGKAFLEIARNLLDELAKRARGEHTHEEGFFPKEIAQISKTEIRILWTDRHESLYAARALRVACPCAQCVDENTGRRILEEGAVKKDISVTAIEKVGRYAVAFRFSDGHATGIYTFDHLRKICPCEVCAAETVRK